MKRRRSAFEVATGLLVFAIFSTSGCGTASRPGGPEQIVRNQAVATEVRIEARRLALALSDLPRGFRVGQEVWPGYDLAAETEDPWQRRSAYAVIFDRDAAGDTANEVPLGRVTSSVNTYATAAAARAAFISWRAALPATYRLVSVREQNGEQGTYVQEGSDTCLIGMRIRNVMASVYVAPTGRGAPPIAAAQRLARLVSDKITAS